MTPLALSTKDLFVRAKQGPAFRGIGLEVSVGEALAITSVGSADLSGLLEVLAGLREPDAGTVRWNRLPALDVLNDPQSGEVDRYRARRWLRQTNAFVSDSVALLNNLTVAENIALPLRYHFNAPENTVRERTETLLAELELEAHATERPAWLSIGVRRRAALGRALILEPTSLFLDAPISDIDEESAAILLSVLAKYSKATKMTTVVASFDCRRLLSLVERVLVIGEGRIVETISGGSLEETKYFERLHELHDAHREIIKTRSAPTADAAPAPTVESTQPEESETSPTPEANSASDDPPSPPEQRGN
ncbi:MAG: ATP-binding cassette domain-containing protein [Planctomycetota bacterium]